MQYTQLGDTGIKVSKICLGTMTYGEQNTEQDAHEQLDYALERGINFVDTAELYAIPPRAETQGLTEKYIGTWIKKRKSRDKIILATKIAGPSSHLTWIGNGKRRFDEANIRSALEGSLKRLQTDYVDLYQLHWPNRKTNFFGQRGYKPAREEDAVPIEETLVALGKLVQEGKIRAVGVSNETPWGIHQYLKAAETGLPRIASIQNPYSLVNRTFESGLAEFSHREGTGLLAYSPLAFGLLSGKYRGGQEVPTGRLTLFKNHFGRYSSPQTIEAADEYARIAEEADLSPAQMALAFVNSRPFLTSNIIGATTMDQLKEDIDSIDIELPKEILKKIEKVHNRIPNPAP